MEIAPIPANEEERLAALNEYQILYTANEEIFDNITRFAATICETPTALITFADQDKHWFKSVVGMPGATHSSRDIAFCSHVILKEELMEVLDATMDKRFYDNPLVLNKPNIRFYAGMPLTNPQGYNLGVICVVDYKPKKLTAQQKETLQSLAKVIVALLEMRRTILKDILARKAANKALEDANQNLEQHLHTLKQNNYLLTLLTEMSTKLQTCITLDEAYAIINKAAQKLFPNATISLYSNIATSDYIELVSAWGMQSNEKKSFMRDECFALKNNQLYHVTDAKSLAICKHASLMHDIPSAYLCLPLIANGESLGLLCLEFHEIMSDYPKLEETQRLLSIAMGEQIAFALANIKHRESLHYQSIHDPLTALFNRRHLEEVFKQELLHVDLYQGSFALLIVDIDYFKKYNDNYGHEAGDIVLQQLADILQKNVRKTDYVFRYGGEEFVLLLHDASPENILERVEQLHKAASQLRVIYDGKPLDNITVSMGIAFYPYHGKKLDKIINIADVALYQAKSTGRNKFVLAPLTEKISN